MRIAKQIIYADVAQTGAQLRKALKQHELPKVFFSTEREAPAPQLKVAQSEEAIYFTELAERAGYSVDDVVVNENSVKIRTKF